MTYYLKHNDFWNHPEGLNLAMINDENRLELLLKPAIDMVESNKTFIDLGCGTGLLGLYALEKGAKFVYFVEQDPHMVHILEKVLPKKCDPAKFKIIPKLVANLTSEDFDSYKPDVVVSEFFGPKLFDEGYVNYVAQVKKLFPDVEFIPEIFKLDVYIGDVDYEMSFWPKDKNLVEYYHELYYNIGFDYNRDRIERKCLGSITFDTKTQQFNNELLFDFLYDTDQCLYVDCMVVHKHLFQYRRNFGFFIGKHNTNKKFMLSVLHENHYNPRLSEVICAESK